jgi:hypothetical protein
MDECVVGGSILVVIVKRGEPSNRRGNIATPRHNRNCQNAGPVAKPRPVEESENSLGEHSGR